MTPEKVSRVISLYRQKFVELGITPITYPHNELLDTKDHGLQHCHGMLAKMETFIQEGRIDKVFRWLGFLQGFLWSHQIYTLTELMEHSRPDGE